MATLHQLTAFIAVAETKKMSIAGKILFLSQPTVSQIVASLEDEYDTKLFLRRGRMLELSSSGEVLYERAKEVLDCFENLNVDMKKKDHKKILRIGATMTVGDSIISDIIKKLQLVYSDIDPYVFVENTRKLEQRILRREVDIAIVEGVIEHEKIAKFPAVSDKLKLICPASHPLASKPFVEISDLHGESFALREFGSGTRNTFDSQIKYHNLKIKSIGEFSSTLAILEFVKSGLALAVLSPRSVVHAQVSGDVVCRDIEGMNLEREFFICYSKERETSSQMTKFIQVVKGF